MSYKLTTRYPSKRAFITGGGGSLGRAMALKLAADGWTIGITDISEQALAESAKQIEQAGGKALTYRFDVANKAEYQKAFEDYISKTGGLDVMINNAGVGDGGLVGEYSLENWDWITGINQMATVYGSHFAVQVMKKQKSGHILSIASAAGLANMPNMGMYNVTKAAVISLMETLYAEVMAFNIRISVACPTFFRSNIMQHHRGNEDSAKIGQTIIERAKFSATDLAEYILTQTGEKKFYILHPWQARMVYFMRRFLPMYFLNYKAKEFSRKDWVQKTLSQKF
ncbi:MAG TPA: SDR family NAD(P)-dependent oxidoreductase [Chitinophagales bacterium]|nr:SDR family NAD(P)-dependent oxidoreductase [Chitinophagales bacterium]